MFGFHLNDIVNVSVEIRPIFLKCIMGPFIYYQRQGRMGRNFQKFWILFQTPHRPPAHHPWPALLSDNKVDMGGLEKKKNFFLWYQKATGSVTSVEETCQNPQEVYYNLIPASSLESQNFERILHKRKPCFCYKTASNLKSQIFLPALFKGSDAGRLGSDRCYR